MPKAKRKSLADILRQAIAKSGQSDYAIAKATGISQPIITRFRNGTFRAKKGQDYDA